MSLWTNPSQERSTSLINNVVSELSNYARIKISSLVDPNYDSREVLVFPGMEYIIKYHDEKLGIVKKLTGLVCAIHGKENHVETCIEFKYRINDKSCSVECNSCNRSCHNKNGTNKSIPICNCVLNPPKSDKYSDPIKTYIPIRNILDIRFNRENMSPMMEEKHERGTRVMILGISATTIKAIIIHLKFFDDCLEKAVKYVDLSVGNVYDVIYLSNSDNTIYEFRGKLEAIQEFTDEPCKNGKGFVRETVGCYNRVIPSDIGKKDFMELPPVKKIKLVFDTSDDFIGNYTTITLDSIRDCNIYTEENSSEVEINNDTESEVDPYTTNSCCSYKNNPETRCYVLDDYKIFIDGDNVTITNDNEKTNVDMSEVLKFYLGI